MIYRITHKTTYKYRHPVSYGNHVACLTPRSLPHHRCVWNELRITPPPATRTDRTDYFGNQLSFFTIKEPHRELIVEARSEVTVDEDPSAWTRATLAWEDVARSIPSDHSEQGLDAYQYVFDS